VDSSLLRRSALERLSSPEQLDTLTQVTRPRGWLALAAAGVILLAALIWSGFGRLPEFVDGSGILIRQGGIFNIQAMGEGQISELLVDLRTHVLAGQPVARLAEPVLSTTILQSEASLASLKRNRAASAPQLQRNLELDLGAIRQELTKASQSVLTAQSRVAYLETRVKAEREALASGLLTDDQVQSTISQLDQARDQAAGARAQIESLKAREVNIRNASGQAVFALDQQIASAERDLNLLKKRFDNAFVIRSPYAGEIVELLVDPGEAITPGTAVARIEMEQEPLEALVFVPRDGKRLGAGMVVHALPEGIRAEEHGYILGRVVDVSRGPLSPQGINRYLRNDLLVQRFGAGGGAYLVRVDLLADPASPSGFKWTSGRGPAVKFGSGALIASRIRIRQQRPIELVIPALRRLFGN